MATDGALFLRGAARMLNDEQELESHTHSDSFLMYASVIVGLLVLAYFFWMRQIFLVWVLRFCCGRETSTINDRAIIVHEGRTFDLNAKQRRAVLEVIFSETGKSQTVTEKDMMEPERKNSKSVGDDSSEDDEQVPNDVEIPAISTDGPEGTQDSSYSMEVQAEEKDSNDGPNAKTERMSSHPPQHPMRALSPASSTVDDRGNSETEVVLRSASSSLEEDAYDESPPALLYAASLIGATRGKYLANSRSLALPSSSMNLKPPRTTTIAAESGEKDVEESKKEEETASSSARRSEMPALSAPVTLMRVDSLSQYSVTSNSEYTSDDETEGNVCAICLSGYKEGDVSIASKYCTHIFHKDCILEWLDKHDECPVCRVDMVTEGEINKAATTLVGKTRMCKAVASMSSAHLLRRTPPPHRTPPASPGRRGPQRAPPNTARRCIKVHGDTWSHT